DISVFVAEYKESDGRPSLNPGLQRHSWTDTQRMAHHIRDRSTKQHFPLEPFPYEYRFSDVSGRLYPPEMVAMLNHLLKSAPSALYVGI
ncbi:hypothetical protein, partial [Martelella mediterranea]|uniref:hypothetical protein n=1 Tax=Martelella mediterranea TaxID=293089 RepID=UPI001A9DF237